MTIRCHSITCLVDCDGAGCLCRCWCHEEGSEDDESR